MNKWKDDADKPIRILSGGEKARVALAKVIVSKANFLMLDEPTAGMSASETDYMVDLIRKVTENKTLIVVEHDMGVVFDLADRISVLVYGQIIESDTPQMVRESSRVQEAYLGSALEETH